MDAVYRQSEGSIDNLTSPDYPEYYDGPQDAPQEHPVYIQHGLLGSMVTPPRLKHPPKTRDAIEAVKFARHETQDRSRDWTRLCLMFVRMSWDLPYKYPSAQVAWNMTPNKHKHKYVGVGKIPYGAPVFSRRIGAPASDSGHVFLACGYTNGNIKTGTRVFRSNDIGRTGYISPVSIDAFAARWGHEILGWASWLNGYALDLPKAPASRLRK